MNWQIQPISQMSLNLYLKKDGLSHRQRQRAARHRLIVLRLRLVFLVAVVALVLASARHAVNGKPFAAWLNEWKETLSWK